LTELNYRLDSCGVTKGNSSETPEDVLCHLVFVSYFSLQSGEIYKCPVVVK